MNQHDQITQKYRLDPQSPSGLAYKTDILCGPKGKEHIRVFAGEPAGSKYKNGYWMVKVGKKYMLAHRVVAILNGVDLKATDQIDHLDGNKDNNEFQNLRIVDRFENARNHKIRVTNKTGVTGVCFMPNSNGGCFRASFRDFDKKNVTKSFAVSKYGYDNAFKLACDWRIEMIKFLNTLGAGYTSRHIGVEHA